MKILEVALLITGILWCISLVYLIYAIGIALLTFNLQIFITAVILVLCANAAQLLLAVLND
jgi:hypothetical protein